VAVRKTVRRAAGPTVASRTMAIPNYAPAPGVVTRDMAAPLTSVPSGKPRKKSSKK